MQTKTLNAAKVQALKACEVALHKGEEAWSLLGKEAFLAGWDSLYEACPWATVFQSRVFVTTWYQTYRTECEPILITAFEGASLTGLLTLTKNKKGLITGAGESQAEYQVWMATGANDNSFIRRALAEVHKHFPGIAIKLKYLPATTPVSWIQEDATFRDRCALKEVRQPLMKIDAAHFSKELQKKNRKEKVNRLKRLGELQLERITAPAAFAAILDELTYQYDFRKKVMHNRLFFLNDPLRKKFILSLFEQGLLHTTVLKVNEEIIASNVGVADKGWVHLQGINTHSPLYARYSPGILHFLFMGKLLAEEGVDVFDLTPGADSYKDQLATDHTTAYELQVGSRSDITIKQWKHSLLQRIKQTVEGESEKKGAIKEKKKRIGQLKEKFKLALKQRPAFLLQSALEKAMRSQREAYYVLEDGKTLVPTHTVDVNKNSIRDLLLYEAKDTWQTQQAFLEQAMRRLETGQTLFSISEQCQLKCCVWVDVPRGDGPVSMALHGFYYRSNERGRLPVFLTSLVQSIVREFNINAISVHTQDSVVGKALELLAFKKDVPLALHPPV